MNAPRNTGAGAPRASRLRQYPRNSPQAAARIVALALLADGRLGAAELRVLDAHDAERTLGLRPSELPEVVDALCDDLLADAYAHRDDACCIEPEALQAMLDDVDDPALRAKVLRLCVAVIESQADGCDAEAIVLSAALRQWGVAAELLADRPLRQRDAGMKRRWRDG